MRRPHVGLRARIIATVVILLAITTASTLTVLYFKMRDASARGEYLSKHINRYLSYQSITEQALLATARSLADRPDVVQAVIDGTAGSWESLRPVLQKQLKTSMSVDGLLVVDSFLNPLAPTESDQQLASLIPLCEQSGETGFGGVAVTGTSAYLLAIVPVRNESKRSGFLLLAQDLQRVMNRYSEDSDSEESKRHGLALDIGGGLPASTVLSEDRQTLQSAIEGRYLVPEGKLMALVMDFDGRAYDLTRKPFSLMSSRNDPKEAHIVLFRVRESFDKRVSENLYPVLYVGLGGLLVAILLALLLASTIVRPVRAFTRSLQSIAQGEADLTQRLPVEGQDDLATLASTINELFENLSRLVWQVRDAAMKLGQSSQEVAHVAQRTLEGARGQVRRIEDSTSLSNELSRTIQEIASRANQGAQIALQGKESVQKSDKGMERIRESVSVSWERVNALKTNVVKVGAIAELIARITEENSMLALNASIEAARAGVAGQGFAVVAQQMREQAKRVDKSSRDIIENIHSIQSVTTGLVDSMEDARKEVDGGSRLVNVTLHHLAELSTIMGETAESVREQATASDEIAQMMLEVQRIGHEALEASQQTVEEGDAIRERASTLSGLVGRFELSELSEAPSSSSRSLPSGRPGS